MYGPSVKRRLIGEVASSREIRLQVGANGVVLQIQGEPDVMPVTGTLDASTFATEQWVGDGAASFAQSRGQRLWSTFLSGAVGLAVQEAASEAAASGDALTIRVVPDTSAAPDLWWAPWELLADPSAGAFLALTNGWSVVRGTTADLAPRPLPEVGSLRTLFVSLMYDGGPAGQIPGLAAERASMAAFAAGMEGRVAFDAVEDLDQPHFVELLETAEVDVIHVVAVADAEALVVRDPSSDEPIWPSQTSMQARDIRPADPAPHHLSAEAIAAAVAKNHSPALLVLNCPDTAGVGQVVAGTTGVAVVAHRGPVDDLHAAAFTDELYRPIAGGQTLDLAIAEARRGLERRFPGEASWASTVLFTGWPPAAFGTLEAHTAGASAAGLAPPIDPTGGAPRPAADLARLLHERNLERLRAMPAQDWLPIGSQRAAAEAGAAADPGSAA